MTFVLNEKVEEGPRHGHETLARALNAIASEVAAIGELSLTKPGDPGAAPVWQVVGSLNQVAADLRRLRMSLEEPHLTRN